MRALSCAAWNDAVLSISITATMCCRQMSGMSRLSTTAPTVGARRTTTLCHVVGVERALPADVLDRVERRLNRRADRPLLDVGVDDLEPLAEAVDQHRRIALRRVDLKEVVVAREHVVHAVPARADEQRRGDAVSRRHAAEDECLSRCDRCRGPRPRSPDACCDA